MAGSRRNGSPLQSDSIPHQSIDSIRRAGQELQMNSIPRSRMPPPPPSPADTSAPSTEVVGDQPIRALSAVSGLEDSNDPPESRTPGRLPENEVATKVLRLMGTNIPVPHDSSNPQPRTPPPPATHTTATSIGFVADQPIPAVPAVNGQQHTDNPPQSPAQGSDTRRVRRRPNGTAQSAAQEPNTGRGRPRRNGTARDPNSVGIEFIENKGLWDCNLWLPGVDVPGHCREGVQLFLGSRLTKQEAQDAHDRAALKLFQTDRVVPVLNSPESDQVDFMEEHRDWNLRDVVWLLRRYSARFTSGESSMKGVSVSETAEGKVFVAKISCMYNDDSPEGKKVHYSLGKFRCEDEAGRAYDRALLFLHHKHTEEQKLTVITNFRPSRYTESEILRAGKDNNMTHKGSSPPEPR